MLNESTTIGGPNVDRVYAVLADGERRAILGDLAADGGSRSVSTLEEHFGDREDGARSFRIRLTHKHLPKMTAAGIVTYDRDDERVTLTRTGRRAETIRRRAADLFETPER